MSQGILLRATALLSLVTGISEGVAKRLSPCYHHSWLAYQPALQPKDRFCNLETIYFLEFKDDERQSSKKKKKKKKKKEKKSRSCWSWTVPFKWWCLYHETFSFHECTSSGKQAVRDQNLGCTGSSRLKGARSL